MPLYLDKFLKHHTPNCTVHLYSGDRHCSCGLVIAIQELDALRERITTLTAELNTMEKNYIQAIRSNLEEKK